MYVPVDFKMTLWYPQFFQKTNEKFRPDYYIHMQVPQVVFVRFLEELKTPKEHFEIN